MERIKKIQNFLGNTLSWLTALLVLVVVLDVALRYLLGDKLSLGALLVEIEWHIFAMMFLLGASYTLQADKHVRVDLFYGHFSVKTKALVNLLGTIFLLIPFTWIVFEASLPYVQQAWIVQESSPDAGGLPARYLIKSCIILAMLLLILQACVSILENWRIFRHKH